MSECSTSEPTSTRRAVLQAAGASTLAGAVSTLFSAGAAGRATEPRRARGSFRVDRVDPEGVFPQSVASGGPTPTGVVLWTRIGEAAYERNAPLGVVVARDPAFEDVVYRGTVPATEVTPARDYTVRVDLDGELDPDAFYHYRFVYDGDASRTGRCRTLPAPDASPERLRLAVASCNNYLHGYFGAFAHVAEEDVDYLLHLGDFLYEYAGEGQQAGRDVALPSGESVAHTLADFRHLHRTYRGDEHLQWALERHTLVHTWDDHEIVNNRWWNYETDAPETQSHPYGDDPELMKQLYVAGIGALAEYVPTRFRYAAGDDGELDGDAIHDEFRLYRSVRFGDLAELFVTDERLYRSPPPEDQTGEKNDLGVPPNPSGAEAPGRSMLGETQREWFLGRTSDSGATWTVWANSVLNAALRYAGAGPASFYLNYDAWDGYRSERALLMDALRDGVDNLVTLTGDMHTYVASYLLADYEDARKRPPLGGAENRVGVEFMTPAVSSDNLAAAGDLPADYTEDGVDALVQAENPWVEWFNSSRWGYSVVEFTPNGCAYSAYGVDRADDSADAERTLLRTFRVPEGRVELRQTGRGGRNRVVGDLVAESATRPADDVPAAEHRPVPVGGTGDAPQDVDPADADGDGPAAPDAETADERGDRR